MAIALPQPLGRRSPITGTLTRTSHQQADPDREGAPCPRPEAPLRILSATAGRS